MFQDEYKHIYFGALGVCALALTIAAMVGDRRIDVAALRVETEDFGAIETASTPDANAPAGAEDWNYPQIPWRSYEEGVAEAARTRKPAVLVLQASWCLMCRDYQRQFATPEVEAMADDYVFILADVDKEPTLQRRYNVDGGYVPRTFVLDPDGEPSLEATGDFGGQRYFVDPYRADALAELLTKAKDDMR